MQVRKFISSAAFASALMMSTALVPAPAWAQKGQALAPVSSWAVTQVNGNAGNGYCALARRYNQNVILTIAMNAAQETTFALDFQRVVFSAGKTVNVVLDPGAGQVREYDLNSASGKALIARMGRDESFFEALEKTGFLRAVLGGQAYHFDLSDIDAGQANLGACLDKLSEEAQKPVSPGSEALLEASSQQDIDEILNRLKALEQQNAQLQSKIERAREAGPQASAEFLREENESLKSAVAENTFEDRKVLALRTQITELRRENEGLKNIAVSGFQLNDKQSAELVSRLERENKDLRTQVLKAAQTEDMQQHIQMLQQENTSLKKEIQAAQEDDATEAQSQVDALKKENKRLQNILEDNAQAQIQVADLQQQIQILEQEKTNLQQQLNASQSAAPADAGLKADNERLKQQLTEAQERLAALQSLEKEAQDLRAEKADLLATLEGNESVAAEMSQSLTAALEDNKRLQAELNSKAVPAPAAVNDSVLQQKLNAAQKENETLKAELQKEKDKRIAVEAELDKANQEIARLNEENTNLRNRIKELSVQPQTLAEDAGVFEEARRRIVSLEEELSNAEADKQRAMQGLARENLKLKQALGVRGQTDMPAAAVAPAPDMQSSAMPEIAKEPLQPLQASEMPGIPPEQAMEVSAQARPRAVPQMASDVTPLPASAIPAEQGAGVQSSDDELTTSLHKQAAPMNYEEATVTEAQAMETRMIEEIQGGGVPLGPPASAEEMQMAQGAAPQMQSVEAAQQMQAPTIPQEQTQQDQMQPSVETAVPPTAFGRAPPPPGPLEQRGGGLSYARQLMAEVQGTAMAQPAQVSEEVLPPMPDESVLSPPPMETVQNVDSAPLIPPSVETENVTQVVPEAPVINAQTPKIPPPVAQELPATTELVQGNAIAPSNRNENIPPASMPPPQPVAAVPVYYKPTVQMQELLQAAKINPDSGLSVVERASGPNRVVYQWQEGPVYGSAEQKPLNSGNEFDTNVKIYLEETQKRCPGDYAIVPDNTVQRGDMRIDSYEVACIGQNISSSASLVFFSRNGTFNAVAHETNTDSMAAAMDMRDRLFRSVSGT